MFHLFAILEIYLVLSLVSGLQPTILDAFVFESTNRLIAIVFKFVPMRIGVDEAGTGMFADLLAFGTATGVTLAVVRKARMLVWMALGIATLVRPRALGGTGVEPDADRRGVGRHGAFAGRRRGAEDAPWRERCQARRIGVTCTPRSSLTLSRRAAG